jgi:hypothetical protein
LRTCRPPRSKGGCDRNAEGGPRGPLSFFGKGAILKDGSRDPSVSGARDTFDFIAEEARLDGTAIQTVGVKGYDGFAIAIVT